MSKLLTRDEVQSIVNETTRKVVLQPTEIDNLYNELNHALNGMGFYTRLERVKPKQAKGALGEFKQGLVKVKSHRQIIEPLLTSLMFRQALKLDLPLSTCSTFCMEEVDHFFQVVGVLTVLANTRPDEVEYVLPTHATSDQLIISELPKIYRAYFKEKCGSGDGPGTRFIVAVLNKAGIKNQNGREFTIEGVVKFRNRAAKTSTKRKVKV
jgi:hypothetical protein